MFTYTIFHNSSKTREVQDIYFPSAEVAGKDSLKKRKRVLPGKWEVFNESLLTEISITKAQLSEIEQRHKELVNLEKPTVDLRDLFHSDIFTEEQGENIGAEMIVNGTKEYVNTTKEKFGLAVKYKKRNPCKILCCWCCPCCDSK